MGTWVKAADLADIADSDVLAVTLGDRPLALYNAGGTLLAADNLCTHAFATLSDGYFDPDECTIECPLHAARFDLRTGQPLEAPATEPLRTYPVKIEDGTVLVDLG